VIGQGTFIYTPPLAPAGGFYWGKGTARMELWQISVGTACAGIEVDGKGVVVNAAPIFRWMVGKRFLEIRRWVDGKNGTLCRVV